VADDTANTVFAFLRTAPGRRPVLVIANFTPVPRHDYRVGVPLPGIWHPLIESDSVDYGGSDTLVGPVATAAISAHGHEQSLSVTVGPLAVTFLAPTDDNGNKEE
jgi:1,4-alpha-glucan branching enzyme